MKISKPFLGAALGGFLLIASASAALAVPSAVAPAQRPRLPVPIKIVHPTGLPLRFKDVTVQLAFTIDETGTPRDVVPVGRMPDDLKARLLPAVAEWRFTPMYEGNRAVPIRVVLPLELVEEP